jgi:large subunit GTPase 1
LNLAACFDGAAKRLLGAMPAHGGRRTTTKLMGLGAAIDKDRRRKQEAPAKQNKSGVADGKATRSILEQSSLDDFMAAAELGNETFECERGTWQQKLVVEGPQLIITQKGSGPVLNPLEVAVPVPRRPQWSDDMDAEELADLEGEAFLIWRRGLAKVEEHNGLIMTPYEKNLDFWRQLWRTIDRSDLLVQIIDSRDPSFYRSRDLERYVKEQGKKHLILLNKADFLNAEMREKWSQYFKGCESQVIFFSALRELHKQGRSDLVGQDASKNAGVDIAAPTLRPHGDLSNDEADVLNCERLLEELRARLPDEPDEDGNFGTVGFVGYPNVGKSSVINAIYGAKKVSMGRVPGKTKHLQTLDLAPVGFPGITLCDCPGLVFPSVVATKAHLVINGTIPIEELRDFATPLRLIVEKMGLEQAMVTYGLTQENLKEGCECRDDGISIAEDPARALLAGLATARQHFLRRRVPDETWAARKVLLDYFTGRLLHCENPPNLLAPAGQAARPVAAAAADASLEPQSGAGYPSSAAAPAEIAVADKAALDDDDFDDLDDFLNPERADKRGHKQNTGSGLHHSKQTAKKERAGKALR